MKFFVTFCFLILIGSVCAQDEGGRPNGVYKYGLQLGTSFNSDEDGLMINALLTHSNNKHQFEFGPKFYTGSWSPEGIRFGLEANYKYYPNTKITPFSSFLLFNTELYHEKGTVYYMDYYTIPNEVHAATRTWLSRTLAIQMGYGIEWCFLSNLYLTSDIGFGGNYLIYNGEITSEESALNSSWKYDGWSLTMRASASLGWRF